MLKYILEMNGHRHEKEKRLLNGLDYYEVTYERDLIDSSKWDLTLNRVFLFLGVESSKVKSSTLRTDLRSYQDIIENYEEVYEYLSQSVYTNTLDVC